MGDENETTDTSGFFSSLLGDGAADTEVDHASAEALAAEVVPEVLGSDDAASEQQPEETLKAPRNLLGGRDWTFLLAWALIGIGVLFVVWALVTNG